MLKLTSVEWTDILHSNFETKILDYDGWRNRDEYEKLELTAEEYLKRFFECTCYWKNGENINAIKLEILGEEYIMK